MDEVVCVCVYLCVCVCVCVFVCLGEALVVHEKRYIAEFACMEVRIMIC